MLLPFAFSNVYCLRMGKFYITQLQLFNRARARFEDDFLKRLRDSQTLNSESQAKLALHLLHTLPREEIQDCQAKTLKEPCMIVPAPAVSEICCVYIKCVDKYWEWRANVCARLVVICGLVGIRS